MTAKLLSVQVGKPVNYPTPATDAGATDKTWRSAIDKRPVEGPVWVGALGLEGDKQADLRVHGGPYRAVNAYPSEHYEVWRATPGLEDMCGGAFGENFTTQGLLENEVCIGDVYRVGEVALMITQPRGPCYKLNRRWRSTDLMQRAEESARIGWYFSVLQEGLVESGQDIERVERVSPGWTIARVWSVLSSKDQAALRELLDVKGLSAGTVASVHKKLKG